MAMPTRALLAALGAFTVLLTAAPSAVAPLTAARQGVATAALPSRLSDADFWKLETDISEPGGYFRITDNYTSNEREIGELFTMLGRQGIQGGVYLGVGPEQNFSYIAAIHPVMAFVVDIRRQAVMQHLMYKAIFEMAADRADFISLLFSKPRPPNLAADASIQDLWNAFGRVQTDTAAAPRNAARIVDRLTGTHGFAFTADERDQLTSVIDAFVEYGPSISTRGSGGGGGNSLTFADLTGWTADAAGVPQSFLSTDEHFRTVKTLEERNLLVPVSGDFGGPKAIRAIGAYLHAHGGTVSAFYVSNVEQYLFQDGKDRAFYDNVATLPLTERSVFIRPYSLRGRSSAQPLCGIENFLTAVRAGRAGSYNDSLACAS